MEKLFRVTRQLIADKNFKGLYALDIKKPERFNWVTEVFENINIKVHGAANALVWTDGKQTVTHTFEQVGKILNQFLNFLRSKGVTQQDIIFSQMPLIPANWLCYLVAIKGGFRLIPAATILNVNDIVYRFNKLMPTVVIADAENATKIDAAEKLCGKKIKLKIIVGSESDGWLSFSEIEMIRLPPAL